MIVLGIWIVGGLRKVQYLSLKLTSPENDLTSPGWTCKQFLEFWRPTPTTAT